MLQENFELQILACLEQNEERYVSLEAAVAERVVNDIQQQLQACISAQESSGFEIKVIHQSPVSRMHQDLSKRFASPKTRGVTIIIDHWGHATVHSGWQTMHDAGLHASTSMCHFLLQHRTIVGTHG